MKIQNPHDKFFKETFGQVEVAKDFLSNYLPKNIIKIIDVDTLQLQKDSFINEELQESFSDLLFKVDINKSEGYIYFLFEHKSYISKDIAFQLLKYMIEIWEAKIKKERTYELPVIIPLVIYHGKNSWDIKTSLGQMITGYEHFPQDIKKYAPNYEYLLYDLSRYTDEEIKGEAQLRIILTILRDIFTKDSKELPESVLRAAYYLQELEDKQTGIEYLEILIRYIFSARADLTKKDMNKIIDKIENTYPEGSEVVMTLAEQLRAEGIEKGRAEGIEKGRVEGRAEALVETAIKLLTKKFGSLPEEFKTRISKLDTATLELVIDNIFEYQSLKDVKKYIS
ncbi:MAG: Rpn family recombination-promoting nuclease/putative transposase [Thermoanaerobacteraceae bacterium]|nr:Rpn family recombination-promoting nuclease/putative transposase [Thermoanaerobacteraceae bacterium]